MCPLYVQPDYKNTYLQRLNNTLKLVFYLSQRKFIS